jgi:hypothetical protein
MRRIYRIIPVLMLLFLIGGCTFALCYSEMVTEGSWSAALYRDGKEAFVYKYEWDGTEEGLRIEPDEVEGCLVTRYGGFYGRGLPMAFYITIPDAEVVSESDIPADAHVDDLTFTMVISKNIIEIYAGDLERFFYLEDEDGNVSYYRLLVDVELDPDNTSFYMKDDRLYEKDSEGDREVQGIYIESVEEFDPENRETASSEIPNEDDDPDENFQFGEAFDVSGVSGIGEVYSSDQAVCLCQDYLHLKSVIIDGDEEIPVDIEFGMFTPSIEKFDVNGDGKEEYLIAVCERGGIAYCEYELVIVREEDGTYYSEVYNGKYFSKYVEDNVTFRYDGNSREVSIFEILPPFSDRWEGVDIKLEQEAALKDIVWSNVIRMRFEDDRVFVTALSGYIYEDCTAPDYEQAALVTLGLHFYEDGTFGLFVNDISEYDGD